ncbi:zinc-dependent metalloprotease [Fulvivirga maritima]|uniref:zinc-dependent metalloprotease n=1 Tax=Fulvivirga maritima TaxID=2904247 RepID=UPI001F3BC4DA|nr:zinc-dependent metalloprotease [Fulvivirga maritima]UII26391.1 zinc-dependent metalloprotease [Fulvivirga maritima]
MLKSKYTFVLLVMLGLGLSAQAQDKKKEKEGKEETAKKDSVNSAKPVKIKKFEDVIKPEMQLSPGFINTYSDKENFKYFFHLSDSIFGRDILVVNRIAEASADMRNGSFGLVGDEIGESVYRFEKGPKDNIFMRRISFSEYNSDSTNAMYQSVMKNNVQAIAKAFPIAAYGKDSSSFVLDVTEFFNSDNNVLYFENQKLKDRAGMGAQQNDRSYIKYVRSYSSNLEIRALKTYSAGMNPTSTEYTVELNSSFVLLPEEPMRPRLVDERVGYFAVGYRDFGVDPQGVEIRKMIKRWRLEPKAGDEEKYLRGELVEPKKPIVFYIDPATPKKWVPYLMQGVNDWQKAFESVGFKNAIYAREAPTFEEDSAWSLDNAKYSAIIYRPSEIANAMGPSISDPRSGEIIESHIFWYHNVTKVLHDWYMVQCGAIDPEARKLEFDDELMGELIRFVSSHEVGHTLGLLHNFGASSRTPVEKLRDKEWVEEHGHTTSIMDYARFNYVAQPEDNIGTAGIFPRINDYDKWALYWGYKWRPEFKNEQEEQKALVKMVTDTLAQNDRLWFGNEMEPMDPRSQNEDLGDDAMLASEYGMKNLKRITPQILEWNTVDYKGFEAATEVYSAVFAQYYRYVGHVLKNVGGVYHDVRIGMNEGPEYTHVKYDKQKRAVAFLNENVFETPIWLNEEDIYNKLPNSFGIEISTMQQGVIESLIKRFRITTLMNASIESEDKAYSFTELLNDLNKGIFRELYNKESVDFYRRNLQKMYVERLIQQVTTEENSSLIMGMYSYHHYMSDMKGIIVDELKKELKLIDKTKKSAKIDDLTRIHLEALASSIRKKLDLDD